MTEEVTEAPVESGNSSSHSQVPDLNVDRPTEVKREADLGDVQELGDSKGTPDMFPKKYMNEDGTQNQEKLLKGYDELNRRIGAVTDVAEYDWEKIGFETEHKEMYGDDEIAKFQTVAKEAKLSQEQYKAVLNAYDSLVTDAKGNMPTADTFNDSMIDKWGDDFKANAANATKGLNAFAPAELVKNHPELAYHPVFAEIMATVGAQLGEDTTNLTRASDASNNVQTIDVKELIREKKSASKSRTKEINKTLKTYYEQGGNSPFQGTGVQFNQNDY